MNSEREAQDCEQNREAVQGVSAAVHDAPFDDSAGAPQSRVSHDIRASLAIINGFSLALGSTFQELNDQYDQFLNEQADLSHTEAAERLMLLEADCRFCLSRLCSSIDQLKSKLNDNTVHTCSETQGATPE